MGKSFSCEGGLGQLRLLPPKEREAVRTLWNQVLGYSFDSLNFHLLKRYQDEYVTSNYGFVEVEEIALLVIELKRFFVLSGISLLC